MGAIVPTTSLPHVHIDLSRVRHNAQAIAHRCGVPVIAVIKADAYGLGAVQVVEALKDLDCVAGFYCFSLREAVDAGTWRSGKSTISLVGQADESVEEYRQFNVRPAVWDAARAAALKAARPVICIDTGMQRFACPRDQIDAVIAAGGCDEAFTHATRPEHASLLAEWCAAHRKNGMKLHAAATSLLDVAEARLDFVRPGLALYRDAVRVTTRLIDARDQTGPAGYSGFTSPTRRHGILIGGYAIGLRAGPCLVNGQPRRILECGMQSSYVEIGASDRAGDEVVLLGDGITVDNIAAARNTSPQEAMLRFASLGRRKHMKN
jgi:alanine racemase